jgi:hypothetical protein
LAARHDGRYCRRIPRMTAGSPWQFRIESLSPATRAAYPSNTTLPAPQPISSPTFPFVAQHQLDQRLAPSPPPLEDGLRCMRRVYAAAAQLQLSGKLGDAMNRKFKIALLSTFLLFAILAVPLCALLIQNYREQFDMQMSYAVMTWHVRNAVIALVLFAIIGAVSAWRLVRLVRGPASPN